jgi:hypothetical protein
MPTNPLSHKRQEQREPLVSSAFSVDGKRLAQYYPRSRKLEKAGKQHT